MTSGVVDLPIAELVPRLQEETVTLEYYFDQALARVSEQEETIRALEPEFGRRERLLAEAEALRERFPRGARPPLFGVLVGVKDLFKVEGLARTAGSRLPAEAFEGPESRIVRELRSLGAVPLGITVSTEFAYFSPGPTRNPRNPEHTPGGSSSGSAAAVAAGYCRLALGTQTIGSISRPAAFCGIVGLKPSFDTLPVEGTFPFSPSADHVGLLTATVDDAAVAFAALSGEEPAPAPRADPAAGLDGRRFCLPDRAYLGLAEEETRGELDRWIERLEARGARVIRTEALSHIDEIRAAHRRMIAREFAETHADLFAEYAHLYSESSRALIEEGREISNEELEGDKAGRIALRRELDELLAHHSADAWLSPSAKGVAPEGIERTGDPVMNLPWTYAGLPTVSVPAAGAGGSPTHLPLGLQIAGRYGEDGALLAVAREFEALFSAEGRQ
jgi:Asp-tRNA(Asn)/Glu-tRNA(Gln) amidotransferase A subunit family amidase